ncbi:hypothetical protein LINPERPRIM_LOCUS13304, partial [Linum perenne]
VAKWSKTPDSSSGPRKRAWVQIPLLTTLFILFRARKFTIMTHNLSLTLISNIHFLVWDLKVLIKWIEEYCAF